MTVSCDDLSADSPAADLRAGPTPALLALKRFTRKTLRHLGLGFASIMIVLGLNHGAAGIASDAHQAAASQKCTQISTQISTHTEPLPAQGSSNSPPNDQISVNTATSDASVKPFYMLAPKMTNHRLTGARLSIPTATGQTVASLSGPSLDGPSLDELKLDKPKLDGSN